MAAVDLSMPFTSLVFAIGVALAAGTSTLISISLGKGDLDRAPDVRAGLPGPHRPVRPALDPSGAAERRREVDPRLLGRDRGCKRWFTWPWRMETLVCICLRQQLVFDFFWGRHYTQKTVFYLDLICAIR